MKLKLYLTIFISLSFFIFSCKTASKLYEKGNYDEAVQLAAKKLQKDPDDAKLIDIITNSYDYAVKDYESRIRSHSQSKNELKYELMYTEYVSLQRMYEAIYKVPSVFEIVKPINYSDYLITYKQKAADVRFDRGIAFMQRYTKKSYQDAYREFQLALYFSPGDRNAALKREEAYEYAVTNIIIQPIQEQGGFIYSSYNPVNNNFDDQLVRNLQNNTGNQFVKFYSVWDARSRGIRIDQEVDLRLVTIDPGRQFDNRSSRKVSKEIVVKETVYKPDSIVKEYARVNATIITTQRTINSGMSLQINVSNNESRRLWTENINAAYNWSTQFATFNGDERALSDGDKQLVNRRHEFAPTTSEIMRILLERINDDAHHRIRNYTNRF